MINLTYKSKLKGSDKIVSLSNVTVYYTLENIKNLHKNNKLKNISSNVK